MPLHSNDQPTPWFVDVVRTDRYGYKTVSCLITPEDTCEVVMNAVWAKLHPHRATFGWSLLHLLLSVVTERMVEIVVFDAVSLDWWSSRPFTDITRFMMSNIMATRIH
jgi:hypothetical protein